MMEKFVPIFIPAEKWLNSQMSIAKHYMAIIINGELYVLIGEKADLVHCDFVYEYAHNNRRPFVRRYEGKDAIDTINMHRTRSRTVVAMLFNKYKIDKSTIPSVEEKDGSVKVTFPVAEESEQTQG